MAENIAALVPAANAYAVTPNDTADLPFSTRGLMVGVGGDVIVDFVGAGRNITLKGLLVGVVYPMQLKAIKAAGTTAGSIIALY